LENVKTESALTTDELKVYRNIGQRFASHDTVNHSDKEYARIEKTEDGDKKLVTTNTIKDYFGIFKRGMIGIYQHCNEWHLHRYAAEFDFRYNTRTALGFDDKQRTEAAIRGIIGKRPTYQTTSDGAAEAAATLEPIPVGRCAAGHHLSGMAKRTLRKTTQWRVRDDGWRLPDVLWAKMEPLLPARPKHPLGCHNPRVPDRAAMDAIFFVPRTGCRWNALRETTIRSSFLAHRRFREWLAAGVSISPICSATSTGCHKGSRNKHPAGASPHSARSRPSIGVFW
jgi:hypothetical protein